MYSNIIFSSSSATDLYFFYFCCSSPLPYNRLIFFELTFFSRSRLALTAFFPVGRLQNQQKHTFIFLLFSIHRVITFSPFSFLSFVFFFARSLSWYLTDVIDTDWMLNKEKYVTGLVSSVNICILSVWSAFEAETWKVLLWPCVVSGVTECVRLVFLRCVISRQSIKLQRVPP